MAKLFDIADIIRDTCQDGFDDILDLMAKPCKLTYPESFIDCVNCVYDPIGKKSSNRWVTGGPMPFHAGSICPICNGDGKLATENSENIQMSINWGQITFGKNMPINIRIPMGGVIETRGYLTDLPKVKKCRSMSILGDIAPYGHFNFKLDGEPSDPFQFIPGRYFIANWVRIG